MDNSTFLLTWNPNKFHWMDYVTICKYCQGIGSILTDWSTCSKQIKPGDTFYLLMQGMKKQNGIIGKGVFVSNSNEMLFVPTGGKGWYVEVRFDMLKDFRTDDYPSTEMLKFMFPLQCWTPMASGILVREEYTEQLNHLFDTFI